MQKTILQSNPGAGYLAYKAEIDEAVIRVLESRWYILGQEVKDFEQEFAAYCGATHAIGVASGTDALQVALRACGVEAGDLVFTVAHTAVATVTAIDLCGAIPVFVDVDPDTFVMDAAALEAAIEASSGRGKVVLPVHLYGHPADMQAIVEIAKRHNLRVIEDCAQSHGATLHGRKAGTWGDMAAYSFYPTKNLGALGDGGCVTTSNDALAQQARLVREYGWEKRYVSSIRGMNSRLDELQAGILRVKLRYLDEGNERRRAIAAQYDALLKESNLKLPQVRPEAVSVYHQYVVCSTQRDQLQAHLKSRNVGTLVHYPVPVHLQPAYAQAISLPNTERLAQEVLSLPMYPELSDAEVEQVVAAINSFQG